MNNKKNLFLIHETQKNLIKSAKARVTGTIPYCHTYDYSLWDGGDIHFCGQKQTLIGICNFF
jgi:hypothetical protein